MGRYLREGRMNIWGHSPPLTPLHQALATGGFSGLNHQLVKSDKLSQSFLSFAATQCAGYSPLYEQLALGIANDESLLDLVRSAPPAQQRPTLLFAAVHEL